MKTIRRSGRLKWLLLPIEIKHRELDAKLWLACCAAERGYGVVLGDIGTIYARHAALPRGVLLDKSIAPRKTKILRRLQDAGYRLCVNDEEALLAYNHPQRYLASRLNRDTLAMTDCYFAWGEHQAELVREAHPALAERVYAVGTPRTDLWTSELRELYRPEVRRIQAELGRYILLPSNFCDVLHVNGPDFRLEQAQRSGLVRNSADLKLHAERRAHRERVLAAFVDVLQAIRERFPKHALVVRPHPSDDRSKWLRLAGHIEHCHVRHDGSATPWLLGADAIFHNGCTTAVEALLLGKQPISYHPFWDDRFEYHFQTRGGLMARDPATLLDLMDATIGDAASNLEADTAWLQRHIRVQPGRLVAESMLDVIVNLDGPRQRLDYSWLNPGYIRYRALDTGKRLERRILRGRSAATPDADPLARQKWPHTTPAEIDARFDRLREVTGRFANVSATHLTGHLFVFQPAAA